MKKILIATDFSEAAGKATEYAVALARIFEAEIYMVHAFYAPSIIGDAPGYIPLSVVDVQQENEALMQREIENLVGEFQINAKGYVQMGTASNVIKDMAGELDADIVIMGTKGEGKTIGVFGSTVIACVRKTKLPVLVIPENIPFRSIRRITFAVDFNCRSGTVNYSILQAIAMKFEASIELVHVQKTAEMNTDEVAGKLAIEHNLEGLQHNFNTVINEDIEKGINDYISGNPTDLLVMVTHQHNLLERLFGTSHTKLIAYHTQLPLLVLHD